MKSAVSAVSYHPFHRPWAQVWIAQMTQDKSRIVAVHFDEIMHQTRDAVLFYFKDDMDDELSENELWLPRSLIEYNETTMQVFLPEYLAQEKGLIV